MENRKEFERFAVLYWGQKVLRSGNYGPDIISGGYNLQHTSFFLQLRSIESLTDEGFKKLESLGGSTYPTLETYKPYAIRCVKNHRITPIELDYLRSIGIAVPFMNYGVEQMIEMGWVKIVK